MNITIIGTGKLARGLSTSWLNCDHDLTIIGHTPGKAEALVDEFKHLEKNGSISLALPGTLPGDVVVLAVPYSAAQSVVHQFIELLPGKILVDATNPVDFQKMELIVHEGSAAEEIASIAPVSTRVVKAFNTIFARTLPEGKVGGLPLDIFLAGDDAQAKSIVAQLIEGCGLHPIDVGPLVRARQLEAMEYLHMAIQSSNNLGYKSAIKILS